MIIRQEQPADYDVVYELVKESFATSTNEGEWDYLNEVRKKAKWCMAFELKPGALTGKAGTIDIQ